MEDIFIELEWAEVVLNISREKRNNLKFSIDSRKRTRYATDASRTKVKFESRSNHQDKKNYARQ